MGGGAGLGGPGSAPAAPASPTSRPPPPPPLPTPPRRRRRSRTPPPPAGPAPTHPSAPFSAPAPPPGRATAAQPAVARRPRCRSPRPRRRPPAAGAGRGQNAGFHATWRKGEGDRWCDGARRPPLMPRGICCFAPFCGVRRHKGTRTCPLTPGRLRLGPLPGSGRPAGRPCVGTGGALVAWPTISTHPGPGPAYQPRAHLKLATRTHLDRCRSQTARRSRNRPTATSQRLRRLWEPAVPTRPRRRRVPRTRLAVGPALRARRRGGRPPAWHRRRRPTGVEQRPGRRSITGQPPGPRRRLRPPSRERLAAGHVGRWRRWWRPVATARALRRRRRLRRRRVGCRVQGPPAGRPRMQSGTVA